MEGVPLTVHAASDVEFVIAGLRDLGLGRSARNEPRTARRSLETVHFGPEYCVASLPLRRTANGDMEVPAYAATARKTTSFATQSRARE